MILNKERDYERQLIKVMRRLKVENFYFNWDRNSCFIEFTYQDNSYRMEHSIQKAREKGIVLRNGMDCLHELIQSLEDLSHMIDRGTYKLETWISGLKQSSSAERFSEYVEDAYTI